MKCRAIPYEGTQPYIFINYCHKDSAALYPVFEQMARDGYRIWYDDGNQAGDDWLDNIENHLEECHIVIAFISGNSSMSHSCKSEIVYAFKCRKKILPVLIDHSELPKGFRMQLSHLQYLKASDYDVLSALLDRIYADDKCKECHTDDGNLLYQDDSQKQIEGYVSTEHKTPGFWDGLKPISVPVRRKRVPPVVKDISVPENPLPGQDKTSDANENDIQPAPVSESRKTKASKPKKVIRIQAHIKKERSEQPAHEPVFSQDEGYVSSSQASIPDENPSPVSDLIPNEESIQEQAPEQSSPAEASAQEPSEENYEEEVPGEDAPTLPNEIFETTTKSSNIFNLEETVYQSSSEEAFASDESGEGVTVRMDSRNLALLLHPAAQRAYILRKPQTKIGRSPIKCDIVIEGNDSISKYHADIIQYQKKIYLRDMNSANGTYINGDQIAGGNQTPLGNPAVFQLSDETLILLSGSLARQYINMKCISLLVNEEGTSAYIMDLHDIPLNRNNPWPDGTLSDTLIHRAAHAIIRLENDGYHLVNDAPVNGNGTYLNEKRLAFRESRCMNPGDRIRLGNTTLEYISISI